MTACYNDGMMIICLCDYYYIVCSSTISRLLPMILHVVTEAPSCTFMCKYTYIMIVTSTYTRIGKHALAHRHAATRMRPPQPPL